MSTTGPSTGGTFRKSLVNFGREYSLRMEGGGFLVVAGVSHSAFSCCLKNIGNGKTFSVEDFFGK